MFFRSFFQKREVRKFGFTPFYYEDEVDGNREETESRIKFRKILRSSPVAKKSVRGLFFLAMLLLVGLFYLWGLIKDETPTFQLEEIRIEETQSNF